MGKNAKLTEEYFRKTSGAGIYDKYPNIADRAHWDHLSKELKKALISSDEEAHNEPWTQLLISDFREFFKSGNRVRFEDKYFPRRRKLNRLIMAECVENKGRFLEDILDGLYLILEETTWCLPPHNSYIRDSRQYAVPDTSRPVVDLFAAETAAILSVHMPQQPMKRKIAAIILCTVFTVLAVSCALAEGTSTNSIRDLFITEQKKTFSFRNGITWAMNQQQVAAIENIPMKQSVSSDWSVLISESPVQVSRFTADLVYMF